MEIQIPVFDYSELLEEAHDRIEEKLILEGDDNIMKSSNVFVDCICESPKMSGLTDDQFRLLIHCVNLHIKSLKSLVDAHRTCNIFRELNEEYETEIAELNVILDCLNEFIK